MNNIEVNNHIQLMYKWDVKSDTENMAVQTENPDRSKY